MYGRFPLKRSPLSEDTKRERSTQFKACWLLFAPRSGVPMFHRWLPKTRMVSYRCLGQKECTKRHTFCWTNPKLPSLVFGFAIHLLVSSTSERLKKKQQILGAGFARPHLKYRARRATASCSIPFPRLKKVAPRDCLGQSLVLVVLCHTYPSRSDANPIRMWPWGFFRFTGCPQNRNRCPFGSPLKVKKDRPIQWDRSNRPSLF